MNEIKPVSSYEPVYQGSRNPSLGWKDISKEEFDEVSESISKGFTGIFVQVLYPAAAYEAIRKENEALIQKLETAAFNHFAAQEKIEALQKENAAQAKRIAELEAATDHLELTPQQAADGLARYKARAEVMEAQRLAIKDLQKEIESLRKQVEELTSQNQACRSAMLDFMLANGAEIKGSASKNGE